MISGTLQFKLDDEIVDVAAGSAVRVAPQVYRAIGNDSRRDAIFMILGAVPPKNFPLGGRTLLGDGIPNRKKVPRWKKASKR